MLPIRAQPPDVIPVAHPSLTELIPSAPMTEHSLKSGLALLAAALLCSLAGTSCTYDTHYYSGRTPGGSGYYVAAHAPSFKMPSLSLSPNWGLVKMPSLPGFLKPGATMGGQKMYWRGDGVPGRPRIHIVISEQRAYYYKGDTLVGESPVCTGSQNFPTPRGNFSIIEKDADHLSSVYGDYIDGAGNVIKTQIDNRKDRRPPGTRFDGAKMYWFMRVVGGVGMHQGYLPGYADSHGCIRLPERMARTFYENTPMGTPVKITM